MKNHLIDWTLGGATLLLDLAGTIFAACLLLGSTSLLAADADVKIVSISNPKQSNGVRIGDVLSRSITLDVKTPYQLSKNAYPVKGSTQNGMELVDFKVESAQSGSNTRYRIDLSYQVFAHSREPSVMQFPSEKLALTGGPQALSVAIPAWHFWFSPLVNADFLTAKANVMPQQKPELIDMQGHLVRLVVFCISLAASLLAAIYINADKRWLPFMNGSFAQAYRQIKRLQHSAGEEKKALMYLHQAFNQLYGGNLFAQDIDAFLARHPSFARMRKEINNFFERSNKALFATPPNDRAAFIRELVIFSKSLRDCERRV